MHCDAYDEGRCRSCSLLPLSIKLQLAGKLNQARDLLDPEGQAQWLETVSGPEAGFRNKAKMVVAGTVEAPVLGILDTSGHGVDLTDCPLYPKTIQDCFPDLIDFIKLARLEPYDVPNRRGELKYLLLTVAEQSGELMLRLVLRSTEALARIRKHLPDLLTALPGLRVVSVNIQPRHMAVIEGEREIILGPDETLPMQVNDIRLHLRPGSFFQTNTVVAAALYRQARDWVSELNPASLWDLYCGVGGFALHCADGQRQVIGIERSHEAILSARRSRAERGLDRVEFATGDAADFVRTAQVTPALVIVNPPRRGLGEALSCDLNRHGPAHILYSSCNATTLARDLAWLDRYVLRKARLFDMFPHTAHYEVCVLLERL